MADPLTSVVELAVGLGCLGGAAGVWRARSRPWLAGLLAVAGLAAIVHAGIALAS